MKVFGSSRKTDSAQVKCAACKTHLRPEYVPWHQHALGCTVRTAAIAHELMARPLALRRVA